MALHPLLLYPLTLTGFRARVPQTARAQPQAASRPRLSICMSVYNEEAVICDKAESLIAMADAYGPADILIYVDGGRDRTLHLLEPYRDRIRIVASKERRGKTAGLKLLVSQSDSDLIAFTDANVVGAPDALVRLQAALCDPGIGCASARLVYTNPDDSTTSLAGAQYWSREELIKARESDTIGVIGVDGALFMVRREIYEFPPDDIIDDLYISLATLIRGFHIVTVPDVIVFERNATTVREEFRRKARISCQSMNVHRLLWPRLRQLPFGPLYGYISHRFLKWMMPFLLLGAALFGFAGLSVLFGADVVLLGTVLVLLAIGLGVWLRVPALVRLVVYAVMLLGVGKGVFESIFLNHRYTTWNPAISVRAT